MRIGSVYVALGLLVAAGALGGCSKKRVAECDEFVATIEKIAACSDLPAASRPGIEASAKGIKDALEMIDQAGGVGDAPADLVNKFRETCKTQNKAILGQAAKSFPNCLK